MNCDSLRTITIPEGVEEIRESAFQGCSKLEKVIIPESIKSIGQNAFKGCKMVPEGMRDTHQIIVIGVAAIVPFNALADHLMDEICRFIETNTDAEMLDETREIR